MAFGIALSGLSAAQTDLDVTANNIANAETTGFKGSRTEFAELFSSSLQGVSSLQAGNGVRVASISQQFSQGNIQNTTSSLDLAVNGAGFFAISSGGALQYTRAGAFKADASGLVINDAGQRLQVYPALNNGGFNTSTLTDLQLNTGQSAPSATTTAQTIFNLPANATPPVNGVFNPTDATSYNNSTSLTMYDSLGAAHTGTLYFVKTATANQWDTRLYIDGTAVGGAQGLGYSNAGVLTTPALGQVNFGSYTPATGAAALNVNFDFSQTSQYGNAFGTTAITQNGYTAGQLTGISVDNSGVVQANFTNGQSRPLGQVALVTFPNNQGLQKLDGTTWAETFSSGQPINGSAGSAGFGQLQSGALEASNVDITKQLVNMIVAQRNYQSNAQMISTERNITQTIIDMAR
ncbi:MAG TPA: flagellar hook protein FlgE [Steroidobacteraceae bacterium]|nr:flagellar hook protein FlgE [Steroidobacteraceae bacterium]